LVTWHCQLVFPSQSCSLEKLSRRNKSPQNGKRGYIQASAKGAYGADIIGAGACGFGKLEWCFPSLEKISEQQFIMAQIFQ
jgi:galactokinase/mevalonate kinase-like predicted kinase